MKLKVTKVLAKRLNEALKGKGNIYKVEYVEMCEHNWHLLTGGNWYHNGEDYNDRTGKFKALKVVYDYDCYAQSVYILTDDLRKLFNGEYWEQYTEKVLNEYAI